MVEWPFVALINFIFAVGAIGLGVFVIRERGRFANHAMPRRWGSPSDSSGKLPPFGWVLVGLLMILGGIVRLVAPLG